MTFVLPATTLRWLQRNGVRATFYRCTMLSSILVPYYKFYSRWIGSQRSKRYMIRSTFSLQQQQQQQQPHQRMYDDDTQTVRFVNHQQQNQYGYRQSIRRNNDCSSIRNSVSRFVVLLFLAIEFLLLLNQAFNHSSTIIRPFVQNQQHGNYLTITSILSQRLLLVASAFTILQSPSHPSSLITTTASIQRLIQTNSKQNENYRSSPSSSSSRILFLIQQQQHQPSTIRQRHQQNQQPLFMFKKPNEDESNKSSSGMKKKKKQIIQIKIDPKQQKKQDRNQKPQDDNSDSDDDDENIIWKGLNLLKWNKDNNSTDEALQKNEKDNEKEEGSKRKAIQSIFENMFFSRNTTEEPTKTVSKNESGSTFKKFFPFFDNSDSSNPSETTSDKKSSKTKQQQQSLKKKSSKTKDTDDDTESKEPYNPLSSIQKYSVSLMEALPKVSFSMPNITMPTINVSLPQISFPFGSNATKKMERLRQKEEEWVAVMPKTRISPGEMVPVTAGGIDLLVIASTDGRRLYCIANTCPHLGTPFETGQLTRLPKEDNSISTSASLSKPSDGNDKDKDNTNNNNIIIDGMMVATGRRRTTVPPFTETTLSDLLQQDGCEDCIVCPLHRTAFALESGEVRGEWCPYPPVLGKVVGAVKPPTAAAVFDIRTRGKNIEVRINTPLV